jgi:hypothetical protein
VDPGSDLDHYSDYLLDGDRVGALYAYVDARAAYSHRDGLAHTHAHAYADRYADPNRDGDRDGHSHIHVDAHGD